MQELLSELLYVQVMIGFDESIAPAVSQVAIFCATEPLTRGAGGVPVDYTARARIMAITHVTDDADGSIRQALRSSISGWASAVLPSALNVSGYTCDGVTDIADSETQDFGAEFVASTIRIELVYQKR